MKGESKMNELTIVKLSDCAYIDSREVAKAIDKQHKHLLRDIRGYCKIMEKSIKPNFGPSDFFLEKAYVDPTGRKLPCYLITKMGCEMIAGKLTGEKGILFTAAYVIKFNEMERQERARLEAMLAAPTPRLGEYNACARIIVRAIKQLGATPRQVVRFLKNTYEPLGISVDIDTDTSSETVTRWYRAGEIAKKCGMYSLNGNPHAQAVSCMLNEIININAKHKRVETVNYGSYTDVSILYDDSAFFAVMQWLMDYDWPEEINGIGRTYHVQYSMEQL
jgi:Rha family phage regulatory protein